jgi:hypothetical protein
LYGDWLHGSTLMYINLFLDVLLFVTRCAMLS